MKELTRLESWRLARAELKRIPNDADQSIVDEWATCYCITLSIHDGEYDEGKALALAVRLYWRGRIGQTALSGICTEYSD
jgi:hypothetical protein